MVDEILSAYKNIGQVMADHSDLVEVLHAHNAPGGTRGAGEVLTSAYDTVKTLYILWAIACGGPPDLSLTKHSTT